MLRFKSRRKPAYWASFGYQDMKFMSTKAADFVAAFATRVTATDGEPTHHGSG